MGGIIISMKRILLSIITVLAVVFSFSSTAMAANQRCLFTDAELEQAFNTIFSKETNSIISNSVDFDRYGTQVVELGSGLTYIYVNEKIASTRVFSNLTNRQLQQCVLHALLLTMVQQYQ